MPPRHFHTRSVVETTPACQQSKRKPLHVHRKNGIKRSFQHLQHASQDAQDAGQDAQSPENAGRRQIHSYSARHGFQRMQNFVVLTTVCVAHALKWLYLLLWFPHILAAAIAFEKPLIVDS
jgi:hypothetical protein